ncbi:hypothetical protein LDENG_00247800 [Lucifuga dentata]|nr:hypothetical protein LDENG_00247800 [Lucifuga dentata]
MLTFRPSSCPLQLEAFPALLLDPRCRFRVFVALHCFSLTEHQSLAESQSASTLQAPSPAWRELNQAKLRDSGPAKILIPSSHSGIPKPKILCSEELNHIHQYLRLKSH